MKRNLIWWGIIVWAIGFSILIYLSILVFTTPNYNYHNTPKPPNWLYFVAFVLMFAGYLLTFFVNRKRKQNPS